MERQQRYEEQQNGNDYIIKFCITMMMRIQTLQMMILIQTVARDLNCPTCWYLEEATDDFLEETEESTPKMIHHRPPPMARNLLTVSSPSFNTTLPHSMYTAFPNPYFEGF